MRGARTRLVVRARCLGFPPKCRPPEKFSETVRVIQFKLFVEESLGVGPVSRAHLEDSPAMSVDAEPAAEWGVAGGVDSLALAEVVAEARPMKLK